MQTLVRGIAFNAAAVGSTYFLEQAERLLVVRITEKIREGPHEAKRRRHRPEEEIYSQHDEDVAKTGNGPPVQRAVAAYGGLPTKRTTKIWESREGAEALGRDLYD